MPLCVSQLWEELEGELTFSKRIGVEESVCRWPALVGPLGSAQMISGDSQ